MVSSQKVGNPVKNSNLVQNLGTRIMRYGKCYSFFLLPLVAAMAFSSCKKEDGIDNNKVIRTPYAVFIGQKTGEIDKTNDGLFYSKLFPVSGTVPRAIITSGNNILFVTGYTRVSTNDGKDWNTVAGSSAGNPVPAIPTSINWASMILDVPGDRIYAASSSVVAEVSVDNGLTWHTEDRSGLTSSVSSFALTSNGVVFAMDAAGTNLFMLPSKNAVWTQVTVSTGLPSGSSWYLTNFNNTLLAVDYSGQNGIYASADSGKTWTPFSGLPAGQKVLSCAAPLGQVVLAGTDSKGVYRLDPTTGAFAPSNNGLQGVTSVYGITGKQDTYKNGIIKRYVYIATNTGLYRSEDLGLNWVLLFPNDLRCLW